MNLNNNNRYYSYYGSMEDYKAKRIKQLKLEELLNKNKEFRHIRIKERIWHFRGATVSKKEFKITKANTIKEAHDSVLDKDIAWRTNFDHTLSQIEENFGEYIERVSIKTEEVIDGWVSI